MKKIFSLFCLSLCLQNTQAQTILYRNCVNEVPLPDGIIHDKNLKISFTMNGFTLIPVDIKSHAIFTQTHESLVICPQKETPSYITVYYKNGKQAVGQEFIVKNVPKPIFHFWEGNKEIQKGATVTAGNDINISTEIQIPVNQLDKRYLIGKVQVLLFRNQVDSIAAETLTSYDLKVKKYLQIKTSGISNINQYHYAKIILDNIQRISYNNQVFPLENLQVVSDFIISPTDSNTFTALQINEIIATRLKIEDNPINLDSIKNKKPEAINMNAIKMKIGYPRAAREKGIQGDLELKLLLDNTGTVIDYIVLQSPHPILFEAAVKFISQLRFTPAIQDGKNIPFWMVVPFKFKIKK